MRPMLVSLVLAVVATSLAWGLSNPLFTLANDSVLKTPLLQANNLETIAATQANAPLAVMPSGVIAQNND
mgnify:FL=1